MKRHFSLFIAVLLFLASCNNATKNDQSNSPMANLDSTEDAQDTTGEMFHVMIPQSGCYSSYAGKDTFLLKTEVFPNVVTGILKYRFYEKDKSEGTIEGKFQGNKLIADYTFSSEGEISHRQVAFLFTDGQAIEGYGEVIEKDGKMVFKDTAAIDFSQGMKFNSIDCAENDQKFHLKTATN